MTPLPRPPHAHTSGLFFVALLALLLYEVRYIEAAPPRHGFVPQPPSQAPQSKPPPPCAHTCPQAMNLTAMSYCPPPLPTHKHTVPCRVPDGHELLPPPTHTRTRTRARPPPHPMHMMAMCYPPPPLLPSPTPHHPAAPYLPHGLDPMGQLEGVPGDEEEKGEAAAAAAGTEAAPGPGSGAAPGSRSGAAPGSRGAAPGFGAV